MEGLLCFLLPLLACSYLLSCCSITQSCPTLCDPTNYSLAVSSWDFQGKKTEVGCHFLLQGIVPTQGLNPCLLHWQTESLPLHHLSELLFVQSLSCVQLFATPWTAACQASLSFTISQDLLKLMSIESVMPSNHLILSRLFSSCLQSLPASGSFPKSQLFASYGQRIGASASTSVLPVNIQGLFPLGWTGLIFLLSKGLSRVFPSTTV